MTSAFAAPTGPAASFPPPPPPGATPPPPPPGSAPPSPPAGSVPPPPPPPGGGPRIPPPPPAADPPAAERVEPAPDPGTAPAPDAEPTPAPATSVDTDAEPTPPPDAATDRHTDAEPAPAPDPTTDPEPSPHSAPPVERHDLSDLLARLHEDETIVADAPDLDAPLTDPRDLQRPGAPDRVVIESTGGLEFRPDLAPFTTRVLGAVIDAGVLAALTAPGWYLVVRTDGAGPRMAGLMLVGIAFLVATVWYARSVAATGQWIGNRVAGTRVVNAATGARLDVAHAATRFIIRHVISSIFLIGFLVALRDPQRRTFHDQIASSVVVGRPRATWSAGDDAP